MSLFPHKQGPLPLPATVDACELLRDALNEELIELKGVIEQAKRKAQSSGQYADPAWFAAVTKKLRCLNFDAERLKEHLASLKKGERLAKARAFDDRLIQELRDRVPADLFARCVAAARAKMAQIEQTRTA